MERIERLAPAQRTLLEQRLRALDGVAAVEGPGERLIAYVVPEAGSAPDAVELRQFLATRLPAYMLPSAWVFVPELPLTANGKLDQARLRVLGEPVVAAGPVLALPEDEVEEAIAGIWQRLLKLDRVGVEDNFFDLGGHSLLLVRLANALREHAGADIPLVELFRFPTVRTQARLLRSLAVGQAPNEALEDASQAEMASRALRQRQAFADQQKLRGRRNE
jgi:acyl carrier protein